MPRLGVLVHALCSLNLLLKDFNRLSNKDATQLLTSGVCEPSGSKRSGAGCPLQGKKLAKFTDSVKRKLIWCFYGLAFEWWVKSQRKRNFFSERSYSNTVFKLFGFAQTKS